MRADWPRGAFVAVALVAGASCATHQAPDRTRVAAGIADRTGINAGGLPASGREWAIPPGTSVDDGLTIDAAVGIALWNNTEFQAALASLGVARADLIDAGLLKNPILSLLFPWGPKQLEFTASWAVDAAWQRPKRIADAKLTAEAVAEQVVSSGVRLVADVRLAFLDALTAERRVALASEQSEIAAQATRLAEGRLRAGDISQFDARLAQAEAVRFEAARLTRVSARELAYVRLRALVGQDQAAPPLRLIAPAGPPATCAPAPELFRQALAARPDVRAAELQIEAAGARAGLERARIVSFMVSLDANAKGSEGFELGPGLSVELPVLSQNQGRRARAAAELEQASRRYLAVRAAVAAEVGAAIVGLTEAESVARLLSDEVTASISAAKLQAERLFAAGEISLLDLLATRQRLIDVEATRVDAEFGVTRATVRLEQAVGKTCGVK